MLQTCLPGTYLRTVPAILILCIIMLLMLSAARYVYVIVRPSTRQNLELGRVDVLGLHMGPAYTGIIRFLDSLCPT